MYFLDKLGVQAEMRIGASIKFLARIEMKIQEMLRIRTKVLLLLVKVPPIL